MANKPEAQDQSPHDSHGTMAGDKEPGILSSPGRRGLNRNDKAGGWTVWRIFGVMMMVVGFVGYCGLIGFEDYWPFNDQLELLGELRDEVLFRWHATPERQARWLMKSHPLIGMFDPSTRGLHHNPPPTVHQEATYIYIYLPLGTLIR